MDSSKKVVKLCDSSPFLKPTVAFTDGDIKKTIKSFLGVTADDESNKKSLNYSHSYFIFIARSEISEDKLEAFYMDLKNDLKLVCQKNL